MAEKLTCEKLEQQVQEFKRELENSKQREQELEETEGYYRAFFEYGMDGVVVLDPETARPIDFNDQVCRQLGYSREEFAKLRVTDIEAKESAEETRIRIQNVIKNGFAAFETLQRTKQGEIRHVHVSAQSINIAGRQVYHCIWRDITESKLAEEKIRALARFPSENPDPVLRIDRDGTLLYVNKACMGKLPEWHLQVGQSAPSMLQDVVSKALNSGSTQLIELKQGKQTFSFSVTPIADAGYANLYGRDITGRKLAAAEKEELERRFLQAQKDESLGAIAHHYNNLLGVVLGSLDLALDEVPHGSGPWENIAEAIKASRRAAEISRLMLAYLGQSIGKREPMDLPEVCREALAPLTSSLPKKTRLKTEFPAQGAIIRADAVQIKQVLTNLVVNAGEAIGDGEGDITVTISVIPAADIHASRFYPLDWKPKAQTYACLSIADTGCGMDPETMEKLFDPFFSTKFTGRGLSLPVVMGIVKAHEGAVTVVSRPAQGATFRVFLPVTAGKPLHPRKAEQVEARAGGAGSGDFHINRKCLFLN